MRLLTVGSFLGSLAKKKKQKTNRRARGLKLFEKLKKVHCNPTKPNQELNIGRSWSDDAPSGKEAVVTSAHRLHFLSMFPVFPSLSLPSLQLWRAFGK